MAIADPFWSDKLYPAEMFWSRPVPRTFYSSPPAPPYATIPLYGDLSEAVFPWTEIPANDTGKKYYRETPLQYKPLISSRLTFVDPYPDFDSITQINPLDPKYKIYAGTEIPLGLFKMNFNYEEIMPLVWNMKEWNVVFSASTTMRINSTIDFGGPPIDWSSSIESSGSVNGKFHSAFANTAVFTTGGENWDNFLSEYNLDPNTEYNPEYYLSDSYITTKRTQPKERVNGGSFRYPPEYTTYEEMNFLPNPRLQVMYRKGSGEYFSTSEDYYGPFNLSFSDTKSIENGNASINLSGFIEARENFGGSGYVYSDLGFNVDSIYLRPDNTIDLYFYLGGGFIDSPQFAGDYSGHVAAFTLSPVPFSSGDYYSDEATSGLSLPVFYANWGNAGSTTVTILGKPLTVYKNYRYEEGIVPAGKDPAFNSVAFDLSLSYDIDVSEFWEYE